MKISTVSFRKFLAVVLALALLSTCVFMLSAMQSANAADTIPAMFDNPIIKTDADGNTFFSADPSVRVFDGKLYMYPSHDIFPANRCNNMDDYHVFSSTNVQDWTDEGKVLSSYDLDWGHKGGFMWAPDCVEKDGKYYFYYPHVAEQDKWETWTIAVASAPTPTGPWTDHGPIKGAGGPGMIDPNVLVDDDGQAYLYYGGSQKLVAVKLKDNMIEITGDTVELTSGCTGFQEGAWSFKKDGTYYMTYAKGRSNDQTSPTMGYATSSSPMGPFTFKGEFLEPNPGKQMDTTHGSVVEYQGEWFVFYHNMALSGFECLRSVCVDRLTFNADGTINPVTPAANTAPPVNKTKPEGATAYPVNHTDWVVGNDGTGENPATFEDQADGVVNFGNLNNTGAYGETDIIDGGDEGGVATIWFQYSTLDEYSAIFPAINGKVYEPAAASPNGSWNTFECYTSTVIELAPGMNTLRITGGNGGVNISCVYIKMGGALPQDTTDSIGSTEPDTNDNGSNNTTGNAQDTTANIKVSNTNDNNNNGNNNSGNNNNGSNNNSNNNNGNNNDGSNNTGNPHTGIAGMTVAAAVAALALGGIVLSKKKSK